MRAICTVSLSFFDLSLTHDMVLVLLYNSCLKVIANVFSDQSLASEEEILRLWLFAFQRGGFWRLCVFWK